MVSRTEFVIYQPDDFQRCSSYTRASGRSHEFVYSQNLSEASGQGPSFGEAGAHLGSVGLRCSQLASIVWLRAG